MGCDIHFVIERKRQGSDKWIGVFVNHGEINLISQERLPNVLNNERRFDMWTSTHNPFGERNYEFFAKLAGVRGDGPDPAGTPDDVSDLANDEIRNWGEDGHSHSWDTLYDFLHTWLTVDYSAELMMRYMEGQAATTKLIEPLAGDFRGFLVPENGVTPEHSYRVIYWFDN